MNTMRASNLLTSLQNGNPMPQSGLILRMINEAPEATAYVQNIRMGGKHNRKKLIGILLAMTNRPTVSTNLTTDTHKLKRCVYVRRLTTQGPNAGKHRVRISGATFSEAKGKNESSFVEPMQLQAHLKFLVERFGCIDVYMQGAVGKAFKKIERLTK